MTYRSIVNLNQEMRVLASYLSDILLVFRLEVSCTEKGVVPVKNNQSLVILLALLDRGPNLSVSKLTEKPVSDGH